MSIRWAAPLAAAVLVATLQVAAAIAAPPQPPTPAESAPTEDAVALRAHLASLDADLTRLRATLAQLPDAEILRQVTDLDGPDRHLANLRPHAFALPEPARTELLAALDALHGRYGELGATVRHAARRAALPAAVRATALPSAVLATVQLSGTVRGDGGAPVASGQVEVFDAAGHGLLLTAVGVAGEYGFEVVAPGTYYLIARAEGYLAAAYPSVSCPPSGYCEPLDGMAVEVLGPGGVAGIDFALQRPATIGGTVTRELDGTTLAGSSVRLYEQSFGYVGRFFAAANGSWSTAASLMPGTYFATAEAAGYQAELFSEIPCPEGDCDTGGTPIIVAPGELRGGVGFSLPRLGGISGRVVADGSGLPIPYAAVTASSPGGSGWSAGDAAGRYVVGGLDPGAYVVRIEAPGYVGELFSNVTCDPAGFCSESCDQASATPVAVSLDHSSTVNFALARHGRISGKVLADAPGSAPIPYARVSARLGSCGARSTLTASDGSWALDDLPSSAYRVTTSETPEHLDEAWDDIPCEDGDCGLGVDIPVAAEADVSNVDFSLRPGGTIRGFVLDAASNAPIPGIWVWLESTTSSLYRSAPTEVDGSYSLSGLPTGGYYLRTDVGWSGLPYRDEAYDDVPCSPGGGCGPQSPTVVPVVAGTATTGRDFRLDRLGSISGRLTAASTGAGIPGYVFLRDAMGAHVQAGPAADDGTFTLDGVFPGSYYLVADVDDASYLDELYDNVPCPSSICSNSGGTPIVVGLSATVAGIDVAVGAGRGISGHVTFGAGGLPAPGVAVDAWQGDGTYVSGTTTDAAGSYFLPLNVGTWYVSTDSAVGAIDQVYAGIPCPLGSAWSGHCNPTSGTAVTVVNGPPVPGIDFALTLSPSIFRDGLESGHVGSWSVVLP